MTHCTRCGRELPTRLDEYGPELLRPLCWDCWQEVEREAEPAWVPKLPQEEIAEAALLLKELRGILIPAQEEHET